MPIYEVNGAKKTLNPCPLAPKKQITLCISNPFKDILFGPKITTKKCHKNYIWLKIFGGSH